MKPPCLPRHDREVLKLTKMVNRIIPNYIMRDDGTIRPASLFHWSLWYESGKSQLALSYPFGEEAGVRVSTVFLGQDVVASFAARLAGRKPVQKLLFETMVFGGDFDQYQVRYATLEDALLGHLEVTELVKASRSKT